MTPSDLTNFKLVLLAAPAEKLTLPSSTEDI